MLKPLIVIAYSLFVILLVFFCNLVIWIGRLNVMISFLTIMYGNVFNVIICSNVATSAHWGHLPLWGRDNMAARWHFETHFPKLKHWNLKYNFINTCRLNWQSVALGPDNSLAPNRRQTIIWTNVSLVFLRIYSFPGLDELTKRMMQESNSIYLYIFDTSTPKRNGWNYAYDIFRCIVSKFSLKFVR